MTAWRLLGAMQLSLVSECMLAKNYVWSLHEAFIQHIALQSIIENTTDEGVAFRLLLTPGVEIDGERLPRVYSDEGAVFTSAENSSTQNLADVVHT